MEKYLFPNYLFKLQLFAESEEGGEAGETTEKQHNEPGNDPNTPKYTDADIDKIINNKFAEWQRKQEKKTSEAERLGRMTAEEKAAEKLRTLEEKIQGYEAREARAEMTKQARAMLQEKNLNVSDELIANLISDNAENTKAAVESFIGVFNAAVEKAVKERVKGDTPKTGTSSGLTKEQIRSITDRTERQRLMKENAHLF